MDTYPDVVERISLKITEKGVTPDRGRIASKLKLLVHEFSIPIEEAERTVTNEMMREYRLDIPTRSGGSDELTPVGSAKPGTWVTIEGKVLVFQQSPSPSIAQKGFIADASGAMEFVVWAKANAPVMEEGKWYRLESAVVDEFKGNANLKVHSGTKITAIEEKGQITGNIPAAAKSGSTGGTGETIPIATAKPEAWVTIEGKVVSLQASPTPLIAQKGVIADASGAIEFVVWAKANAPVMEEGQWYRLESAVVDEFRGSPNLKVHSGTTITAVEEERGFIPQMTPLADITPGVVSVRAKVIQLWEVRHDRMLQTGLIGDETGTTKFVIWKSDGAEPLEEGMVYTIYFATAEEFNGRISLNLSGAEWCKEEGADIEVSRREGKTITGAFVHLGNSSGLIKRCKVEGCNRALSRQNFCPVHEIQQDFRYDLRITGVVDDGITAHNVLLQIAATEKVTGISLQDAVEMAENNPLGFDDVFIRMQELLMGRYVSCSGNDIDGTMLVRDGENMELIEFDTARHAGLINRAEAPAGGVQE